MEVKYPSDITRSQFSVIKDLLSSGKRKTKPRKADLYNMFCAILYINKTGCQWRALPNDYPKWYHVYYYFTIWSKKIDDKPSLFEQALKKISKHSESKR